MRRLILAAMLGCLALAVVGPARAETWYLRQSGDTSDRGVAAPLGYCLRGTAGAGGLCAGPNYRPRRARPGAAALEPERRQGALGPPRLTRRAQASVRAAALSRSKCAS
jgi:hypothetical protein